MFPIVHSSCEDRQSHSSLEQLEVGTYTSTACTVLSTDLLRLFLILVRYFHRQSTNPASVALAARRSYATAKPGECSCSPTELPCWLSAVLSRWLAHFAARFLALGDFRSLSACPQRSDHDPGSHSAGTARGDSTASSRTVHERIQPADTVMPCLL